MHNTPLQTSPEKFWTLMEPIVAFYSQVLHFANKDHCTASHPLPLFSIGHLEMVYIAYTSLDLNMFEYGVT